MKLKTFMAGINELIDKEDGALELDVYYASDDEGNNHDAVHFSPSLMLIEEDGEVFGLDEADEYPHASMVIIIN